MSQYFGNALVDIYLHASYTTQLSAIASMTVSRPVLFAK